jgi:hypothetical protein
MTSQTSGGDIRIRFINDHNHSYAHVEGCEHFTIIQARMPFQYLKYRRDIPCR